MLNEIGRQRVMSVAEAYAPKKVINSMQVGGVQQVMKDISVTLEIAKDVPAIVGVPGELNQVWGNLLDNALDASPAKGQVQIVACREMDGRLVVKFIDNGPGIPEHLRKHVFDQFFTTKPIGQGTGLGLDIARRIVRSHEGAIEFETRPGRTEFRVVLPPAPTA